MRHGKKINHLGRTHSHRAAMLSNMAASLILSKRIKTTVAKAKALRVYVEPLITRSKNDTTHSRRVVFSYLQNKEALKELFGQVAEKIAQRPGGYTRILKLGNRPGDNAEMAMIELVDFNEFITTTGPARKKTTRRRKPAAKKGAAKKAEGAEETTATAETAGEEKPARKPAAKKAKQDETADKPAKKAKQDEAADKSEPES